MERIPIAFKSIYDLHRDRIILNRAKYRRLCLPFILDQWRIFKQKEYDLGTAFIFYDLVIEYRVESSNRKHLSAMNSLCDEIKAEKLKADDRKIYNNLIFEYVAS